MSFDLPAEKVAGSLGELVVPGGVNAAAFDLWQTQQPVQLEFDCRKRCFVKLNPQSVPHDIPDLFPQVDYTEVYLARDVHADVEDRMGICGDQFEELFRFQREAARQAPNERGRYLNDAAAFVKLLLEASRQKTNIYVALTMRSDYLGDCSQFWGLPEAINESQYLIPRLTRVAGFEWGTGFYINPVPPEQAAEFLRKTEVDPAARPKR